MPALFTSAVQPSERLVAGLEQAHDVGLDRDVGGHGQGPSARRFNVRDDPLGGFLVLPVIDTHRVAGGGSHTSRGCPDSAARASDDENVVHQAAGWSMPAHRFMVPSSSRPQALR